MYPPDHRHTHCLKPRGWCLVTTSRGKNRTSLRGRLASVSYQPNPANGLCGFNLSKARVKSEITSVIKVWSSERINKVQHSTPLMTEYLSLRWWEALCSRCLNTPPGPCARTHSSAKSSRTSGSEGGICKGTTQQTHLGMTSVR